MTALPLPAVRRAALPAHALAFVSGLAGLGYELVWTRQFATVLGHEMLAVLGVVAAFFGGLALGAFALDAPLRRSARPLRLYALLEAAIGAWAVATAWLIPAAGRHLPTLLGPDPGGAVLWGVAFLVPLLLLLPATVAMGGTLTALEVAVARTRGDGRAVAGLYGANTAGAVLGAAGSVFALAPLLGLAGTLLAMAVLNALLALAALAIADRPAAPPAPAAAAPMPLRLQATLLLTGLLGVAFEILVVRLAAQFLHDTVFTFACLLAAYLLGTAGGGLAWQALERRGIAAAARCLLPALTSLACLGTAAAAPLLPALADLLAGTGSVAAEAAVALLLFLAPTLAMGALFAALAQQVRDRRGSIGRALGLNALGAALGPALAALLLIPALGLTGALLLVACLYLLLPPLAMPGRAAAAAALPALAATWLWLHPPPPALRLPEGARLLALREGPTASASVVQGADGTFYLEVNGHFRMGGTSSQLSDWRQAQLPLLLHPAPHRALFLGVGTGATLAGAARFPGVAAEGVELVPEVAQLLPFFADGHSGTTAWPDAPVTLADARRFVRATSGHWDVIVADLFHPALDGSGALYTREHFAAVRARLAPGGLFCQWLPLHQLDLPSLQAIIRTFLDVFPQGGAYLAHFGLPTPLLALVGGTAPLRIDPARLAARLADPATGAALRPSGLAQAFDVLGLYLGDAAGLARFAGAGPLNTDDRPFVTFDARRNVGVLGQPAAGRLLAVLHALHPSAANLLTEAVANDPAQAARLARLEAYWQARDRFLAAGAQLPPGLQGRALLDAAAPGLLEAVRISGDFDPAYAPLLAMGRALLARDPPAARRLLAELAAASPGRAEARLLLDSAAGR